MRVCVRLCVCACMHMYIYFMWAHISVYLCISAHICIYLCTCANKYLWCVMHCVKHGASCSEQDRLISVCLHTMFSWGGWREGRIYINKIIISRDGGSDKEREMAALLDQAIRELLWMFHLRSKERKDEAMGTMEKEHSRRKKRHTCTVCKWGESIVRSRNEKASALRWWRNKRMAADNGGKEGLWPVGNGKGLAFYSRCSRKVLVGAEQDMTWGTFILWRLAQKRPASVVRETS